MKIVEIFRHETSLQGTISLLTVDKIVFGFTMEPPKRGNERNISCIPPGQYICEPYFSKRHGQTFKVLDVYERSDILFHSGNRVDDTEGCIMVGSSVAQTADDRILLNSRATFKKFAEAVGVGSSFHLTVSECY